MTGQHRMTYKTLSRCGLLWWW